MPKATMTYFNALLDENADKWEVIEGTDGLVEFYTLAMDEKGDYTRLTRFKAGADTSAFGAISHLYPEEVMIISGRMYDASVDRWLEIGDYASRPPHELHGPFKTDVDCVVLEMSFPSMSV
ncbi:MAG: hypothetical protein V3S80_01175 [Sulfurimonadaceae bacterium]